MKRVFTLVAFLSLVVTAFAALQCVVGGVVTDVSGPLPGVTVTLTAPGQPARTEITDAQGKWLMRGLAPGCYTVTASLEGFNTIRTAINLHDEKPLSVDFTLTMAAISEAITVTAEELYHPPANYRHFEDHGFVDTTKEKTTTFAIDVDRASYANIRRHLTNGEQPPEDAVRIEEMINYFAYDYPQPEGKDPFAVISEVASCPWNAKHRLVRIGVQGRNLEQWRMAPNNLVFLIDVSGSMDEPDRLPLLQQAFHVLVDELRAEDRVAIVTYAGEAGLVLPSTSGANKDAIRAAIDALGAEGSTAGEAGIQLAYQVAKDAFVEHGNNRVILATDGDFNVGVSDVDEMQKLIAKKRNSGIDLSLLGVGDDPNDTLMEMLADKGNGNYAVLDTLQEAKKVFGQELTGTLVTIAKDVKVQVVFDPAKVASYRQIGYENRALANEDFDDDAKDAGELGAGHSVTALYEIEPRAEAQGEIATLRLRYKLPRAWRSTLMTTSIVDRGINASEASRDFQFTAAVAQLGMLLRKSPHAGTATWDDALSLAKIARGEDLDGTRAELVALIEKAKEVQ
ncbi:MAG TPA: von Willebrand factor type A domain-containing protein [Thermoanaerobaculia bacterium]